MVNCLKTDLMYPHDIYSANIRCIYCDPSNKNAERLSCAVIWVQVYDVFSGRCALVRYESKIYESIGI